MNIRTDYIESESVGFRQLRITMPSGVKETYFQEFKATSGWYRLSDGVKASATLEHFIDSQAVIHKQRKADKISRLEALA